MPATPKGFPYPTPDDPVSAGANDIKALAEASDARSFWTARGADAATANAAWIGGSVVVDNGGTGVGRFYFGNPADTSLYRVAAGQLRTDGQLSTSTNVVAYTGTESQVALGIGSGVAGVFFGAASDTSLYRAAGGWLKTDGNLVVVTSLGIDEGGTAQPLAFGASRDATLRRALANTVQTDGNFRIVGSGSGAEQSGLELFIDGAWRRVSRRSDGVMIC